MLISQDNQVSYFCGSFFDPTARFVLFNMKNKNPSRANSSADGGGSDPCGGSGRQNASRVHWGGSA